MSDCNFKKLSLVTRAFALPLAFSLAASAQAGGKAQVAGAEKGGLQLTTSSVPESQAPESQATAADSVANATAPGTPDTAVTPAPATTSAAAPATATEVAPVEAAPTEPTVAIPEKMNIAVPELAPPVARNYRVHRDFYLAVNAGIGSNGGSYDDGTESQRLKAEGFNLPIDLLVGYGATPGVAVGGAVISDFLVSTEFRRDGFAETDGSSVSLLVGPFVDGFPNDRGPLHIGGSLGLAHVWANDISTARGADDISTTGLGFAAWVGYTPWVSDHFSIGAQLRIMANFTGIGSDTAAATRSLNLMLNTLYF